MKKRRHAREIVSTQYPRIISQAPKPISTVRGNGPSIYSKPSVNSIPETDSNQAETERGNFFHKEGDAWTMSYEGKIIKGVKNAKGLHYIAYLLKNPYKNVGVSELVTIVEKPLQDQRAEEFDNVKKEALNKLHIRRTSNLGNSGEILDQKALQDYKRRLKEIDEDLSERGLTDEKRDELREEKEKIEDEISNAFHRGRARKGEDVSERIRKAVTNRIQTSIKNITEKHPLLGKHLSDTIKTGSSCSYKPTISILWNP